MSQEADGITRILQPHGARLLVYGGLSLAPCQADPGSLIFEGKRLEGFWLSAWLRRKSLLGQLWVSREVQKLLGSDLKTEFQARIPLRDAARGLRQYAANMTAGKVLLVAGPSGDPVIGKPEPRISAYSKMCALIRNGAAQLVVNFSEFASSVAAPSSTRKPLLL